MMIVQLKASAAELPLNKTAIASSQGKITSSSPRKATSFPKYLQLPVEIEWYIAEFTDVNAPGGFFKGPGITKYTPLQRAIRNGNYRDVLFLMHHLHADVNGTTPYNLDTPLYTAIESYSWQYEGSLRQKNHFEIFKYLLNKNVDLNKFSSYRQSLMHAAVDLKIIPMLNLLIKKAAPLSLKNLWGSTPLDKARHRAMSQRPDDVQQRKKMYQICAILEAAGAQSTVHFTPMPTDEVMNQQKAAARKRMEDARFCDIIDR